MLDCRMFRLTVLGSGSAGNCALVETNQCRLLLDGGLSARQIVKRLAQVYINPLEIDGILLTHEHCDHVQGLQVFCKRFAIPIYCNRLTAEALKHCADANVRDWRFFSTGREFAIKDITIETFPVPHDAMDPVGFVLHHGPASLGFITDLGFVTKLVLERLRPVSSLVVETNHDEQLLQNDNHRPWSVKQRIMSRHGHLSNAAAAGLVGTLAGHRLNRVVLGHLSRDCNHPDLAVRTVRHQLDDVDAGDRVDVVCALQAEVSESFAIA